MLHTVNEDVVAQNETRGGQQPLLNVANKPQVLRRKSSAFSVVTELNHVKPEETTIQEIQTNRSDQKKLYSTYAEFYLKTKRSGSLAIPFIDYVDKQREELESVFGLLDLDNDKYLDKGDLKKLLVTIDPKLGIDSNINQLIKDATNDESNKINFQQFGDYYGGTYFGRFSRYELKYVFDLLDKDHDSYISEKDLDTLFAPIGWNTKFDLHKMFMAMDRNKDGLVCFEDFKAIMNNYK